jgi:[ribosomal protein S5]-alanine N-acetyltransferase
MSARQETLATPRLHLRPFEMRDAAEVQRLAGDPVVSATALELPHPFLDGMAEAWIASHPELHAAGRLSAFAITVRGSGELCGAVGLTVEPEHGRASLGYWIGRPHWGRGYATEAARVVIAFGFERMDLRRIHADHLGSNAASGSVLRKLGMRPEGILRQHVRHRGVVDDLVLYGILRSEWT